MANSVPNYLPGMEPENIQGLLNSFFDEIDELFPDKTIIWSEWNHDRWDKAAGYLCKTLGYSRGIDFLEAYGYQIIQDVSLIAKPSNNIRNQVIDKSESVSEAEISSPAEYVQCSKCCRVVRAGTIRCPDCGALIIPNQKNKKKSSNRKKPNSVFLIFAIIILLVIGSLLFASKKSSNISQSASSSSSYSALQKRAIDEFRPISEYIKSDIEEVSALPDSVYKAIVALEKIHKEKSNDHLINQLYYVAETLACMQYSDFQDQAQVYLNQIISENAGPYVSEIQQFKNKYLEVQSTPNTSMKNVLTMSSSEKAKVKKYIEERYDYYDSIAGKYSGDKYKDQVWADTAKKFGITETDVTMIWQDH